MHERPPSAAAICQIGPLTLDQVNAALLRNGVALPLGRRAVVLLQYLVQRPGEIVPKDILYDAVWPGQTVEESNLTVQISQLRRALETECPGGRRWVETLARRGYRFVGPVTWDEAPPPVPTVEVRRRGALSNVPIAVPLHFTGREPTLAAMRQALERGAPGPAIIALHGLRGLGKTMLATAFARRHATRYRAIWWVRAEAPDTIRADLAALAVRLGWARAEAPAASAFEAALEGVQQEGDGLLLIYDNAVDAVSLRSFPPKTGDAHLVITSNTGAWRAIATPIEPALWPAETGADFLIARTGRTGEREAALALSRLLGGLPLAHEQAAAYVESLEIPFAEYQRRLEAAPVALLDDASYAPADYRGGLTVAKALHLAIGQVRERHRAALPLLQYTALLATEPIPVLVFERGRAAFPPPFAEDIAGQKLDETLVVLRRLALISRESVPDERETGSVTECIRLHRLVRQIVVAGLSGEAASRARGALIGALALAYPADVFDRVAAWPLARRLDTLAMGLVAPPVPIPGGAEAPAIVLLRGLASYRHGSLGLFDQAHPLFARAFALSEAAHGPQHPTTANILNNFALLLRDRGELAASRPLHERALAIREAAFGPNHPDVAISLTNLSNVISEQGDPTAAVPLVERALAIRVAHFGEDHALSAQMMNNLGRQLHLAGDLVRSRVLLERALAIRSNALGAHDPHTANSMANLALLQLDLGDLERAERLGERALRITEAALGPEHPTTASVCAIFAQCLLARRGAKAAMPHAERALAISAAVLAPTSPIVRRAAAVTAGCLDQTGQGVAAGDLRRRYRIGG